MNDENGDCIECSNEKDMMRLFMLHKLNQDFMVW